MREYISQRAQLVWSYYSGIGKSAVIYPVAFVVAFALWQTTLGLIFFVREQFDASPRAIGWMGGCWSLCYVFGCFFVRPALVWVPARYLIIFSTLCMGVLTLGMMLAPSMAWIFVLYAILGVVLSLFWPPLMGWLSADKEGKSLGRVISRFNFSWSAGNVISPYICGRLSEHAVQWPLTFAVGLYFMTSVFAMGAALTLPRVRHERPSEGATASARESGRQTLLRFPAWVGLFSAYFGFGVINAVFPVMAKSELLLSGGVIGLLLLVRGLLNVAGFVALGRTVFWHFRAVPTLVAQALGVVVYVGLAATQSTPVIGFLMGLVGLHVAFAYSSSIFHGASGSADRSQRMALHESIIALGVVAGSVTGGTVYQATSMGPVWWLCAVVVLLAAGVQAILSLWARRAEMGR